MKDLREWLAKVEALGELEVIREVPWELEMGAIAELVCRQRDKPAILFDDIPGYPPGFRVLINALGSGDRFATTMNLPQGLSVMEMVREWRRRSREVKPLPPSFVEGGPVMENVVAGEEVDLLKFPVPKWHEKDGGCFIGTGDLVITRGPDGDWVNLGTYRSMVQDRSHVGLMIGSSHHGRWHMEEWFAQGKPMPVAIALGMDPVLFVVGTTGLPPGVSEYDYAGAIRGEPIEVLKGPITGLPIPAAAEIVLEGFVDPQERWPEGPFGEFTGYYAGGVRPQPVVKVEAVYYRHNPILLGVPPLKPTTADTHYRDVMRAAGIWDSLEAAGVPDVTGVWCHVVGNFFIVVSVRQRYPGHAKQAARVASQCYMGGIASPGRYTVVVDEDIDVTDMDEVLWAMCTRVDPDRDIEFQRGSNSGALDPMVLPENKGHPTGCRLIIDATRPYEWRERFPEVVASSPELRQQVLARWGEKLRGVI